jgi:hypothetical protein
MKKMKKKKLKLLLQGLRNVHSKYYCEFSEKEVLIIEWAIKVIERLTKPKRRWSKAMRKIGKSLTSFIIKVF